MSAQELGGVFGGTDTVVTSVEMTMADGDPLLSVLFAGVSGRARLHEKLGGTEALRAVDRCLKRVERVVDGFGGRISKMVGDELMAVFAHADDALQAAVEMQQRVSDLPPVSGVKLVVRVGFTHGHASYTADGIVGDAVNEAAQLAGLAKPGQILTSVSTQSALSLMLKRSTREIGVEQTLNGVPSGLRLVEVVAVDPSLLEKKMAEASAAHGHSSALGERFYLRYFGETIRLDEEHPLINLGRDANSDVVVHDRRASRNHACLEWRDGNVFLVDKSTNGTFVTFGGEPEIFLRKRECILRGKGVIGFASSTKGPDADCAEFELT